MSTRLTNYKSRKVSKHSVLFKDADGNYRKTYNTRVYFVGQRKFVLWNGMVCWLRRTYHLTGLRGKYCVNWMQAPSALVS